jgi:hypothetical protein
MVRERVNILQMLRLAFLHDGAFFSRKHVDKLEVLFFLDSLQETQVELVLRIRLALHINSVAA